LSEHVVIMLSGGVESTALIQHALDNDMTPLCHSFIGFRNIEPHVQHIKAITELYGVELFTCDTDVVSGFSEDVPESTITGHWWSAYGAMCAVAYPSIKHFWIGGNSGVRRSGDIKNDPDPIAMYGKGFAVIEQASHMVGGSASAYMPLWRLTKKQQWDMIPKYVQQHIVTCENQYLRTKPCGECSKCTEFRSIHEDEAYAVFCE